MNKNNISFENICLTFTESDKNKFEENIDFDLFLNEINSQLSNEFNNKNSINSYENNNNFSELYPYYYNYDINYTIQQLLVICDYYNIVKLYKLKKENKINIIHKLVEFENDEKNYEIVSKRKKMWFYINELKNDKIMKKYILW
jgi:hypothetical protein